jgi:hypothetical protein
MSLADLAYDVPKTIATHDHAPRFIKRSCTRTSRESFRCAVNWQDATWAFAGTLRVTDNGSFFSTFSGLRARISCIRAHGARACMRQYRW